MSMKPAMLVSPIPTFPRTRDNQRLGCGCLQPSRMASCFTQKVQSNRYAKFYDYESAEEYINNLMGQIKVGWNRVV